MPRYLRLWSGGAIALRTLLSLCAIFAIFAASAMPSFAAGGQTGSITGTVVDSATKAPVVAAKVTAASPSGSYRTSTDSAGRFSILGMNVDTYLLTIEVAGYEAQQLTGVTVTGDQVVGLGTIVQNKAIKTIARTTSRAASGAFQPRATTDTYTVSGARLDDAQGKKANFDENNLILSVPGTSTTAQGRVTIRGGLSNEVGYQLDGVNFTEPFLGQGAGLGSFNGLNSLQVVEGAGDATQGNTGAGVVNVVPKRGSYPGTGLFDTEIGGPNFNHQVALDFGIATRSGNLSNYVSYVGQRFVPYYGYHNSNPADVGAFFGTSLSYNDDLLDNLVFKFGRSNRQSLQVLYDTRNAQSLGQVGGRNGRRYFAYDPYVSAHGIVGNPFAGLSGTDAGDQALFSQFVGFTPYPGGPGQQNTPTLIATNPTQFLKFEYDNALDDKTFLAVRAYNSTALNTSNTTYNSSANPSYSSTGGQRVGQSFELTRSIGSHTLTLQGQLENQKPRWNDYAPLETLAVLGANGTSLADFLPGQYNLDANGISLGNGWVYDHIGFSKIPSVGINYNGTDFQTSGIGLRDQWTLGDALKVDYGVRVDHANYKFGSNSVLNPDLGNFSDVDPSFITDKILHPTVFEPRLAIAFTPARNDAIRVSYGRSVEFLNAQTSGTPGGIYGAERLAGVPVTPGTNTDVPSTWTCGSGLNSSRLLKDGSNASGKGGGFFRCANYLQQLYWAYDQNFDAPDIGNGTSPTYDNYDASYSHQFKNGVGFKATGFYRRASGLPSFFILSQKNDPNTGQILYQVFSVNNNAISKTSGAEFSLTTRERAVGFTGYLSATYQNAISSVPPLLSGEDQLPLVTVQSFQLGNTYRAGFLSPVVFSVGGSYKTKSGLRISPNLKFNAGYPTGIGQYIAYAGLINGAAANVPQTNLGNAAPTAVGYNNTGGTQVATQYVDPAYAGSILNPNIAATRGTKEGRNAGAQLTKPSVIGDLVVEYNFGKRNTIGIAANNLTGNVYYGSTAQANTYYQPVTTGVAGPATGYPRQANPAQTSYANHGFVPIPASSYGNSPNLLLPNAPTTYRLYYQLGL